MTICFELSVHSSFEISRQYMKRVLLHNVYTPAAMQPFLFQIQIGSTFLWTIIREYSTKQNTTIISRCELSLLLIVVIIIITI